MVVVGLIGQTGAGKSRVCAILCRNGVYIIDGDRLAREVTSPHSPVLQKLQEAFGADIVGEDGALLRAELARRAFASAKALQTLNAITHPAILEKTLSELEAAQRQDYSVCAVEGAALLESPLRPYCDFFAAVTASAEVRLARILARDGLDLQAAQQRMAAQQPEEYYTKAAAVQIRNEAPYDIEEECARLLEVIAARAAREGETAAQ